MYQLQPNIFEFFGNFYAQYDSYKDNQGRGIVQRFVEMLADEVDESFLPTLQNFLAEVYTAETMNELLLPYYEESFGSIPPIADDLALRRRMMRFIIFLFQVKGTLQALLTFCRWLNFTNVTLNNEARSYGFDSALTLDDPGRTFDSFAQGRDEYTIHLFGNVALNAALLSLLIRFVRWNEPIDARIRKIVYENIPAVSGNLPTYNAMVNNAESVFSLESGKLTQTFLYN